MYMYMYMYEHRLGTELIHQFTKDCPVDPRPAFARQASSLWSTGRLVGLFGCRLIRQQVDRNHEYTYIYIYICFQYLYMYSYSAYVNIYIYISPQGVDVLHTKCIRI